MISPLSPRNAKRSGSARWDARAHHSTRSFVALAAGFILLYPSTRASS
ncbi:hypothetical protein SJ05684_b55370 (plasmid) [Sinorhizobium sojae CCBAU 05684]|uniref:Uncharacterized protein n=1 Tax=Sinorhizobium sojae CCBAU 05684 TaxID=716928 RepID=A0A249PMJ1_9HYPH|nr:hypothetical protein SJ05684_b55370 [Sinorhizobium sojae CCBAU 05684]